jgi:hypothetical protein
MLKGRNKPQNGDTTASADSQPQFKENPQVNAKIDDYIKNNPKHWDYIQSMPPDRMARALVLTEVQKLERREKMHAGIMKKLDENPEMKQAYETLVKNLPEDQREKMMTTLAARTMRTITPRKNQPAQEAGVRV